MASTPKTATLERKSPLLHVGSNPIRNVTQDLSASGDSSGGLPDGDLDNLGSGGGRRFFSAPGALFEGNRSAAEGGSAGSAQRGAQRLENTTDNSSPPRLPSASKWAKLDWLRVESSVKRQRSCMSRPLGKTVGVRLTSGVAGISGVMHCGRVACPNCGPRIGAVRREEINRAVSVWRERGGVVLFLTLTLRHDRGQSFEELTGALSSCWAAATGGKQWVKDRARHGIAHTLRVWEEKWSIANGWHTHVHALLFLDPAADEAPDVSDLLASMFARWARKAVSLGLGAPLLRGQDLHVVEGDADAAEMVGSYFAKQVLDDAAESMAWELSNPNGKGSGDSFTPAELLELAVGGDPEMARLWGEYERGMTGRRTIAWSKGLRDAVGLDDEKSDQDIADEELSTEEDTVISMTARSWMRLSGTAGHRRELLRLVTVDGPDVALDWLRSLGLMAVAGLHDFGDES